MSELEESYARCRVLAKAHGTTYAWATALLPRDRRRHVWALYAFVRLADDIVDEGDTWRVTCEPGAAEAVREALEAAGIAASARSMRRSSSLAAATSNGDERSKLNGHSAIRLAAAESSCTRDRT